jgi:hypothetical protein
MKTEFINTAPVLPSANIERDVEWYRDRAGFEILFSNKMYAALYREKVWIHLQWHADTKDDPLLGGSVVRIFVKNILPIFDEFVRRGTVKSDALKIKTLWQTNEFGFYDLNNNSIFIVEDIQLP